MREVGALSLGRIPARSRCFPGGVCGSGGDSARPHALSRCRLGWGAVAPRRCNIRASRGFGIEQRSCARARVGGQVRSDCSSRRAGLSQAPAARYRLHLLLSHSSRFRPRPRIARPRKRPNQAGPRTGFRLSCAPLGPRWPPARPLTTPISARGPQGRGLRACPKATPPCASRLRLGRSTRSACGTPGRARWELHAPLSGAVKPGDPERAVAQPRPDGG